MKRLYNYLLLKQLYKLETLGYKYTDTEPTELDEYYRIPNDLEELEEIVSSCNLCELRESRNRVVFGEGNLKATLMFIGEGPGATEDSQGKPFVGKAGVLLTRMIENAILISRAECYIANIVKCRPPKNRVPTPSEAMSCLPYLHKQLEIIKPKIVVTLGSTAYRYLTGDKTPISRVRGRVIDRDGYSLLPTFHPSYLLRNPSAKRFAYADMLRIRDLLSKVEK